MTSTTPITPIKDSQISLEFFANVLALKGVISVDLRERVMNAVSISDLDGVIDALAEEMHEKRQD